jgi:hypothetical protein
MLIDKTNIGVFLQSISPISVVAARGNIIWRNFPTNFPFIPQKLTIP